MGLYMSDDWNHAEDGWIEQYWDDLREEYYTLVELGASVYRDYEPNCYDDPYWNYGSDDFDMLGFDCITYNWCMPD